MTKKADYYMAVGVFRRFSKVTDADARREITRIVGGSTEGAFVAATDQQILDAHNILRAEHQARLDAEQAARDQQAAQQPAPAETEPLTALVDWPTFWATDWSTVADWLIDPVLPLGRATHIYSRRGLGKSEFSLHLAIQATTAGSEFGRPDPMTVLYLDNEMSEGDLFERLSAFGCDKTTDLDRLHYAVLPSIPPIDGELGGLYVTALCRQLGVDLVIVDSLQSFMAGEENSNDSFDNLRQWTINPLKRDGVTSLWLGNTGKDPTRGSRGGSRKEDVLDCIWELQRGDGNDVTLRNTKKRAGWVPDHVNLQRIEDDDGIVTYRRSALMAAPSGTATVVERLDAAGIPLDASVRTARALLKAHDGHAAKNNVLAAALSSRRDRAARGLSLAPKPGRVTPRVTPSSSHGSNTPG